MSTNWSEQCLTFGFQYYVAGRSAALVRLVPVSGNLLHHAVEMILKGVLSVHYSPEQLRVDGYSLPKLWDKFRQRHEMGQTSDHGKLITELQAFEDIRYPDKIILNGASMSVGFGDTARTERSDALGGVEPEYAVDVCKVDCLIATIFRRSSFKLDFFLAKLTLDARRILGEGNEWLK